MIQYEKVTGDFDLTGKNAIVVGGAGGIGERCHCGLQGQLPGGCGSHRQGIRRENDRR